MRSSPSWSAPRPSSSTPAPSSRRHSRSRSTPSSKWWGRRARGSRRCSSPAAWSTASAPTWRGRSPRSTASWGSTSCARWGSWSSWAAVRRFRSRTIESLVAEARDLEAQGVQELCLIAQDTTRYGEDIDLGRHGLVRLVEALLEGTNLPWIRFLYAYPTTLDEDLLRLMGNEARFCSYIDMPLQHSDGEVLARMRRGGDAKRYLQLLDRARVLVPDVFLRSTFIVGFPGETEAQFQDLLGFVERARFDHLGAFAYSPEEGTPSAELAGRVPKQTVRRRLRQLLEAQKPIALAQRRRLVGTRLQVLVEGVSAESEHLLEGRHHGMAPEIDGKVLINDGTAPAASFAEVEITEAHPNDLVGSIVGPVGAPGVTVADTADAADIADFALVTA